MIDLHWSASFVGIPFVSRGRTRDGADCWGVVRLVYAEKLGIGLPAYDGYASAGDHAAVAGQIATAAHGPEWVKVEGRHRPFDVLVFRRGRFDSHVGVQVQPGVMLHAAEEEQSRIESYAAERWAKRLVGVYRHRDVAGALPSIVAPADRKSVRVAAGPVMTPDGRWPDIALPPGMTIDEIVARALPGALPDMLDRASVTLQTSRGTMPVDRGHWSRVRPHAGVLLDIRIAPAGDKLKSVLGIVVAIAALAAGVYLAPILAGASASAQAIGTWQSLIGLGVLTIGTIAINALVPVPSTDTQEAKPNYQISSWRNSVMPDGVVPSIMGRHRYAPPFAFAPYTEIENGKQFVCAVFNFGYGRVALSSHRIGETPLTDFEGVRTQVRDGASGNGPIGMYPRQVIEEAIGTELLYNRPQRRTLARDCKLASAIFLFPQGQVRIEKDGDERAVSVQIRVRSRAVGTSPWTYDKTLTIKNRTRDPFYEQHVWKLDTRGDYEVDVTRLTEDSDKPEKLDRVQLVALQSIRPEYWNNFPTKLALVAIRIRASYQLSGGLDSYNAYAERVCPDWDAGTGTWITRETSNPASLSLLALKGPQNAKPVADSGIDFAALQDWHVFCTAKGLRYDRVHDFEASLEDVLVSIASAGRASPRHNGTQWTWIIDRPKTVVVDEFNARNSRDFQWETSYGDPPHAVRVPFLDRTNNFQSAERIVPWVGHSGDITIFEQLDMPGKTSPTEVYREARRRMHEARYRSTTYRLTVDGVTRPAARGDLVMLNHDVLARAMRSARVVNVLGARVSLDDAVEMEDGTTYAMRWRWFNGPDDQTGTSVVRRVRTIEGESRAVILEDSSTLPEAGAIVHFGTLTTESLPVIVKSVERGEDMTSLYTLIATSDQIDEDTDAEEIPDWSGRVGDELTGLGDQPQAPSITRVLTGRLGTGDADGLIVFVVENAEEDVALESFEIDHRLFGAGSWSTATIAASEVAAEIAGYFDGDVVQLRPRAVSIDGVDGVNGDIITVTIGADDGDVPAALPDQITVTPGLGSAVIEGATGSDAATVRVQVYRSLSNDPDDLDRDTDAVGEPILVVPNGAYSFTDGDPSRKNIVARGDFSARWGWTMGSGWSIADGVASHAGGGGTLSRPLILANNAWYRCKFDVDGRSAGTVTPRLSGGTAMSGSAASSNGQILDRWHNDSGAGNDTFGLVASSGFDGSVDDILLYRESAACIPQGTWYYWLEPQNAIGLPGPLAGPYAATII